MNEQCPKGGGGTLKYPTNEPPPPPNISQILAHAISMYTFFTKNQQKEKPTSEGDKNKLLMCIYTY